MKPSGHTNYYGFVFGGSDLEGPKQSYLYFLVAQDGTWLVKRRTGDATVENVAAKATSDTDGIYGIRVNHLLEVQVDGLAVTNQSSPSLRNDDHAGG